MYKIFQEIVRSEHMLGKPLMCSAAVKGGTRPALATQEDTPSLLKKITTAF